MDTEKKKIVIWSLTLSGAETALKIREQLETRYRIVIMVPEGLSVVSDAVTRFDHLKRAVAERFNHYNGHIFIMAAGIAVRMIAPLIRHKTKDPAVVVVDERGRHAISLLSGHIGGANTLARDTAHAIGGQAVITTATDVNDLPAIDEIATNKGLSIENPEAIKAVHMALLEGEKIRIFDPYELIRNELKDPDCFLVETGTDVSAVVSKWKKNPRPGVFTDDRLADLPPDTLLLRPRHLAAGIGCNRNTPLDEIMELIHEVFVTHGLSVKSIGALATIDIKKDEPGLNAAAIHLNVPIRFFSSEELNHVNAIQTPSETVRRITGAKSVCEAAAILAAKNGPLIISKKKTPNVTLAVARAPCTSSASDRGQKTIFRHGRKR